MKIKFENVTIKYSEKTVIDSLFLDLPENKMILIAGPSGSGKTTLLKSINGIVNINSGTLVTGQIPKQERINNFGYIIQKDSLFEHYDILENLLLAQKYRLKQVVKKIKLNKKEKYKDKIKFEKNEGEFSKKKFYKKILMFFEDFSLNKNLLEKLPSELSGGQYQRVSIIRSLLLNYDSILMDEPFSALDPIVRRALQNHTYRLIEKYNKTIIMVSHDPDEILRLADQIVLLKDGKLFKNKLWTPKEIKKSKEKWIQEFFLFKTIEDLSKI